MATVYLDQSGLELRPDGDALALYRHGERVRCLPLRLVDRLVIHGDVSLGAGVLTRIGEAGASALFLGKRNSRRIALLIGRPHEDARIRLAQYGAARDPVLGPRIAALWAGLKIRRQVRVLLTLRERRPDRCHALTEASLVLQRCRLRLTGALASGTGRIRGIEGAAAAAYFRGLAAAFPESLGFLGRNRRPPRDPVNALLSLAYTLIHHESVTIAHGAGLDPWIGFLHAPSYGRESLACDLVETQRPAVDLWVHDLFRQRRVRSEHFRHDKGACLLGKSGRAIFYEQYEQFAPARRRQLRRLARLLVRTLRDGDDWLEDEDGAEDTLS